MGTFWNRELFTNPAQQPQKTIDQRVEALERQIEALRKLIVDGSQNAQSRTQE